jgi:hypothetical protein
MPTRLLVGVMDQLLAPALVVLSLSAVIIPILVVSPRGSGRKRKRQDQRDNGPTLTKGEPIWRQWVVHAEGGPPGSGPSALGGRLDPRPPVDGRRSET